MTSSSTTQPMETKGLMKVITASSVGTLIEWYDFYIYGAMSLLLPSSFLQHNPTAAFLVVGDFGCWFARPFGALVLAVLAISLVS